MGPTVRMIGGTYSKDMGRGEEMPTMGVRGGVQLHEFLQHSILEENKYNEVKNPHTGWPEADLLG